MSFKGQFTLKLDALIKQAKDDVRQTIDTFVMDFCTAIVERSPVDTGRFRSNWNFAIGEPDFETTGRTNLRPLQSVKMKLQMNKRDIDQDRSYYFTNALPYAWTLEYGGYPNPPKRGTYNPRTKEWEVRSIGGYSKQAPAGMVRVTLKEVRELLAKAAQENKRLGL